MSNPKVSVISVSFNNEETSKKLVESVLRSEGNIEFIILDNNSEDKTVDFLKLYKSKIKIIESDLNLGFSRGNNKAVKEAKGEYLFFLNPDSQLVSKDSITNLVNILDSNPRYGLIGPKFVYMDGTYQKTVRNLPTLWRAIREYLFGIKGSYEFYDPGCDDLCSVESVVGAGMLIKRDLFLTLGGFDEKYFLYYEDLDLCRKVLSTGNKVGYYSKVVIKHQVGHSGKKGKVSNLLIQSAQSYHGLLEYYLIQLVIRMGRKIYG